ncbi:uncharacterized protein LOC112139011 [Oryzias melastigma]|uniref:uncharacterized protein LOC112139011 n=1 Tax=Oryzias melastigma TaxID=30732 RepID=UPI00168CBCC2|nr:uncharacterized protein LOC112139011 [Oryzias melastigma]
MYCPFCASTLVSQPKFCCSCGKNISYLYNADTPQQARPSEGPDTTMVDELIAKYFTEGHSYEVIVDFLATKHSVSLSLSSLKRRLEDAGLTRKKNYTPLATVQAAITDELKGSGQLFGYRAMWQTLKQKYSFVVKRDDVMHLMAEMDPIRVENRSKRRFFRRVYRSVGPNEVWHVDGYDKLKPFGIAISGCIDGYSRRIMWLKCGKSNNDPTIIAQMYMQCAAELGVIPMRLRTDCGTENGLMAALHCSLRSEHGDEFAGTKSHMYGTSTANHGIESWWSYFRKQRSQFWMDLFGDLRERHLFNGSYLHICLVRFCFLDVLQKELDEYKQFWNTHTIRPVRQSQCPSGKPEAMYHVPHRFDGRNCGFPTSAEAITRFSSQMPPATTLDSDEEDLEAHFSQLQRQSGLPTPLDWEAATENYIKLKNMANL